MTNEAFWTKWLNTLAVRADVCYEEFLVRWTTHVELLFVGRSHDRHDWGIRKSLRREILASLIYWCRRRRLKRLIHLWRVRWLLHPWIWWCEQRCSSWSSVRRYHSRTALRVLSNWDQNFRWSPRKCRWRRKWYCRTLLIVGHRPDEVDHRLDHKVRKRRMIYRSEIFRNESNSRRETGCLNIISSFFPSIIL